jgi:hypothetical protein
MVDFLPPQKNVLRVSFDQHRVKHNLEIVIRESGILLMFSTTRRGSTGWGRYVSFRSMRNKSVLVWEEIIHPEEILEQNIQAWVSYLLSGLDKKFRLDQILQASLTAEAGLNAILRKISAQRRTPLDSRPGSSCRDRGRNAGCHRFIFIVRIVQPA